MIRLQKQNRKTPSGSIFIAIFVQASGRKITHSFWANISAYTSDYELKFSTQTKFDTLILNLNSYDQYKIVMT